MHSAIAAFGYSMLLGIVVAAATEHPAATPDTRPAATRATATATPLTLSNNLETERISTAE